MLNEHACQLRNPDTLRIVGSREREHNGKKYRITFGIPRVGKEAESVEQTYRYPADTWTVAESRIHCAAHDGIEFTAAMEDKVGKAADKLRKAIKI